MTKAKDDAPKTDVFEDEPDARQSDQSRLTVQDTLFRKRYRKLTEEEVALHDAIKDKADELAKLIAQVGQQPEPTAFPARDPGEAILLRVAQGRGANVTLSLRHLEDCVYRVVKALTA